MGSEARDECQGSRCEREPWLRGVLARTRGVRRVGRWLVVSCVVVCGVLLSSGPALALGQRGHVFSFSLPKSVGAGEVPLSNPAGVAVSDVGESAGDVYVVDRGNNRIEKFDSEGNFISAWGWGVTNGKREYEVCKSGEECKAGIPGTGKGIEKFHLGKGQLISPVAIAVDNSTSNKEEDRSAGDVYVVADVALEKSYVYKFGPEGEYKGHLTSKEETEEYGRAEGVAVGHNGVVRVDWSEGEIVTFSDGEPGKRLNKEEQLESGVAPLRSGLAVDSQANLYVDYEPGERFKEATEKNPRYSEEGKGENGEEPCATSPCVAAKLVSVEEPLHELKPGEALIEELDQENTTGLAVAPASNNAYLGDAVYLDDVTSVAALTPTGSLIQRFGSGNLTKGSGLAVSAKGDVYVADAGAGRVDVFKPEASGPPTVEDISAQDVSAEAAQLNAVIDPRGERTSYYFEYGAASCAGSPSAWTRAPGGEIGGEGFGDEGFGDERVSTRLGEGTSLALPSGTTYHYRVVAKNKEHGQTVSEDRCFSTPPATGKFVADERVWEMVSPPEGGAAVEPLTEGGGVTQASEDGQAITYVTDAPVGRPEGSRSLEVTQNIACSSRSASCAAAMGGAQGWSSQDVVTANEHGTGLQLAAAPEYQSFSSDLSLGLVEPFREGGGRLAEPPLSPPATEAEKKHQEKTIYLRDNAPIAPAPLPPAASEQENRLKEEQQAIYAKAHENGEAIKNPGFLPLVTAANVTSGEAFGQLLRFRAATPDLSHVVIYSNAALTSESTATPNPHNLYEWEAEGKLHPEGKLQLVNVLPGAEKAPAANATLGSGSEDVRHAISNDGSRVFWTATKTSEVEGKKVKKVHLYMRDTETAETVQLDILQKGAKGEEPEGEGSEGEYLDNPVFQTANAEGARAFFSDEERLTAGSGASRGKPDLYVFEVTSGGGEPLRGTLTDLTGPHAGEGANIQGLVLGAGEDGTSVYFVANGVLSSQAAAAGAVAGRCVTSAAQTRPPGATCNLYVAHYDSTPGHEEWEVPRFIARLSSDDEPDWGRPTIQGVEADLGELTARVSPNGRYLAFMSDRSLTSFEGHPYDNRATGPGADNAPAEEVFLYDSSLGRLVCASCDPSGGRPVGVLDPAGGQGENQEGLGLLVDRPRLWAGKWLAGSIPGWTKLTHFYALYQSRYLSDSGRLFFDSPDALVSQDTNSKEDVYEYEPEGVPRGRHECTSSSVTFSARSEGCAGLISSGRSSSESAFLDASETGGEGEHGEGLQEGGGDVFFLTAAKLVPQDTESSFDAYDAHECTGQSPCIIAPEAQAPAACETSESCRPSSLSSSTSASPATGTSSGSGNIVAKQKVLSAKTSVKAKPLTRAEKLAKALKACRKLKKKKRARCEAQARRRYRPPKKQAKAKKSQSSRTGRQLRRAR